MFRSSTGAVAAAAGSSDIGTILESFPANIAYVDADLVYRFVNSRYELLFGRTREDIVGRPVAEVLGASGFAIAGPRLQRALAGEIHTYESEFCFPGRETCWLAVQYIPDRGSDGIVRGLFVFAVDITRSHNAELHQEEAEARYRLLYEQAPIGICYYDQECRLLQMNERAASELGTIADSAIGHTLVELLGPEMAAPFLERQREVLVSGKATEHIDEIRIEDFHKWYFSTYAPVPGPDGRPQGLQIVSNDITALKQAEQANREAEARLRQSQKLQAMGSLAGGVAHDFNNILQTVLSFTCEMLDDEGIAPQHREDLGVVRDACRRGASLTAQLLAFSRQQYLSPQAIEAHESINAVFKMVRRLVGEDIELDLDLGAARDRLRADEGQLAQILLNLAVNARDAMPAGGRLTVTTTNRVYSEGGHPELPAGDYLVIGVRDTGCGIAPGIIERIFEPFFTTKEIGHGTGLGLATVFGIVKQHGGHVEVTSRPGEGALFEVILPLLAQREAAAGTDDRPAVSGGSETILLAEDDADVRGLLCRRLRRAGYEVLAAADGNEAVALQRAHPGAIDLAVLDVVMPGRGGCQAYEAMREKQPDLGVLFLSGYPLDRTGDQPEWDPALPLLRKPVSGDDLCREVRRCLDRAHEAAGRLQRN
jgi:PAS domain S-box-containing protein